ncbi:hypothetical protein DESPIGER_2160 [Desulfovibrio piger]|uniref:Uncharacterized protein n=1 Tax=Desulfovibrio piger TaxID=901 RepID=A0A1K1LKH2_9BACT|nr:hypothetical protein DESPIGER_2160 [Desulfovibrio piger]
MLAPLGPPSPVPPSSPDALPSGAGKKNTGPGHRRRPGEDRPQALAVPLRALKTDVRMDWAR